jgi:trk system potassium uptake protein TrkH
MNLLRPIILVQCFIFMLAAGMTVPAILLGMGSDTQTTLAFASVAAACVLLAGAGYLVTRGETPTVSSKQLYLITVGSWFSLSFIGATPLYLALPGISFADAIFESVSGITTTGSTVLTGLDTLSPSILLWRGLLQWIGGIGIIVLGIAVLPYLKIGGMRLFATESSDLSGKILPRAQVLIRNIGTIYIALTVLAALLYWLAGMGPFDAAVHAMTTLATGGYANYDASMGHFNGTPAILWISSFFMLLGALPFILYVSWLHGRPMALFGDRQIRGFLTFIALVVVFLIFERSYMSGTPLFEAATHVTFNVVSIITTTGYASEDYTLWGSWAVVVFFYLMFIGGCSGSTTGSIKFFRYQVSWVMLRNQLRLMRHPSGVFTYKYNGRIVTDDIIRSMIGFSFFFALTIAAIALSLSLTGLDFITSLSAAATAVTNVGPGLGNIVGPAGNFSSLTDTAKWLMSIGMLLGRLEIMTVIVLLTPTFWRT